MATERKRTRSQADPAAGLLDVYYQHCTKVGAHTLGDGLVQADSKKCGCRGLFAERGMPKGVVITGFSGVLISVAAAKKLREEHKSQYLVTFLRGVYVFNANPNPQPGELCGQAVNHAMVAGSANSVLKPCDHGGMVLYTTRQIASGEEILYDYGKLSFELDHQPPSV
jgi:hypothetical protein